MFSARDSWAVSGGAFPRATTCLAFTLRCGKLRNRFSISPNLVRRCSRRLFRLVARVYIFSFINMSGTKREMKLCNINSFIPRHNEFAHFYSVVFRKKGELPAGPDDRAAKTNRATRAFHSWSCSAGFAWEPSLRALIIPGGLSYCRVRIPRFCCLFSTEFQRVALALRVNFFGLLSGKRSRENKGALKYTSRPCWFAGCTRLNALGRTAPRNYVNF